MNNSQKALNIVLIAALFTVSACVTKDVSDEKKRIASISDTRTVLDAHLPEVSKVEARLLLSGNSGQLSSKEVIDLKEFTNSYINVGRGNLIINYPQGSQNDSITQALLRQTQREIYLGGINFNHVSFSAYPSGDDLQPIILSFERFDAAKVDCISWGQIDPKQTASNLETVRFGCSQSANLAAMVIDAGDFAGDRKDENGEAARIQNGVDANRKGELKQVSGSVKGGTN